VGNSQSGRSDAWQAAVTGEQRPIFSDHDFEQPTLVGVSFVSDVDAEQPQVTCELAQVPIGDEMAPGPDLKAQAQQTQIQAARKLQRFANGSAFARASPNRPLFMETIFTI
jgi:hypothetical protein